MLPLVLALALAASGSGSISLAAPNLSGLNLDETAVGFYSQHLAQQLTARGVQVTTAKQIATLIGLEREKQLLGCSEGNSCLTELANALGADGIVTGDVGRFDRKYQLNVKIISAVNGRELATYTARVDGEEALLDEIVRAAKKMAPEIAERLAKPLAPPSAAALNADRELADKARRWAWLPIGAGAVFAAGGALALLGAQADVRALSPEQPISTVEGQRLRDEGALLQLGGYGALGAAALAFASGAAIWLLNPDPPSAPVHASIVPTPGGAGIVFSGVLP